MGDVMDVSDDVMKKRDDETVVSLGWRVYGLTIIFLLNILKATQGYLLIVTIFGMASELKFGETKCQVINETLARDYIGDRNITGRELCAEIGRCSENSRLFLPDVCMVVYTGQGTLYDVLAGPIFLVIQGVAAVPLVGFFQACSIKFHHSIAMLTVLWTLCTLLTAFVNDYWAVALLRFFFGIVSGPHVPLTTAYLTHIFPSKNHTIVFGIFMYGFIVGYGLAYIFDLVSDSIGWRWCYIICGSTGFILAIASCFMVNPKVVHHQDETEIVTPSWKKHFRSLRQIKWSYMICVILSNTACFASFCVSSFNFNIYLAEYFPEFNATLVGLIIIVIGFPSSIVGGLVGDRLRKVSGIRGRFWMCLNLLIIRGVLSTFAFQTPLTTLLVLVGIGTFTNDWFVVFLLSVVSDLTPFNSKAALFAVNCFFTQSIAGSINLIVSPISSLTSLRTSLTLINGVLTGIGAVCLLLPIVCMYISHPPREHRTYHNADKCDQEEDEVNENTPLKIADNEKST